ncbi:hypothetical protein K32_48620 [Kaistia sp. 32K]|uniref:hypothetical protein n=1 Tax=Kaistia sp. 32K TaxID=2795690 RepID=UPI001915CD53|nr:hypothetical protein [Kaistia sp. 32K]BCP56245.1 hypothetical protein K32_48620 [Kaistia sp. 32K]
MTGLSAKLCRPAYERAGEYRRPSVRMRPLSPTERQAARAACSVPPSRWNEAYLQTMRSAPAPAFSLEQRLAQPGQLAAQPRPATPAAPPAVLVPIAAEDSQVRAVQRAAPKIKKAPLSDLAAATLERYRKRYCL